MFAGAQLHALLLDFGVTHVVTLPDSTLGDWGEAMAAGGGVRVVRVCREGEVPGSKTPCCATASSE
jgi:hypothetical protein